MASQSSPPSKGTESTSNPALSGNATNTPFSKSLINAAKETGTHLVEGEVDTLDSNSRYLALLGRIRPVLLPATRYLAYTSDIGEAFRPVIAKRVVNIGYGVSIAYVAGDVGYEGYRAHLDRKDRLAAGGEAGPGEATEVGIRVARRTVFQGLASIVLPAVTIHSAVKYSAPLFLKSKSTRVKGWGPTLVGLAIVPALPIMFDHPVETATDTVFDYIEENFLGTTAEELGRRRKHHAGQHAEPPSHPIDHKSTEKPKSEL